MTEKKIKITFSDKEKRIDLDLIANAIAKRLADKGGENDAKRKQIS